MARHTFTRRQMVEYIRDIRRTVEKANGLLKEDSLWATSPAHAKAMGLLEGVLIHCERARRDLDAVKPKKKEKR